MSPEEIVAHAIAELMRDDRASRSHEEEGPTLWFRLIPIVIGDGKSLIMSTIGTSGTKKRGVLTSATKNGSSVTEALHNLRYRSPQMSTGGHKSPHLSNLVKDSPTQSNNVTQAEAEAEAEAKEESTLASSRDTASSHRRQRVRRYLKSSREMGSPLSSRQCYAAITVHMIGWLDCDPEATKDHRRCMARFVTNWLAKRAKPGGPQQNGNGYRGASTTKPSDSSANRTKTIRAALTELALYRQAESDRRNAQSLLRARLGKENVDDVLGAIRTIQDLPRLEGELSFPEIGACVFWRLLGALAIALDRIGRPSQPTRPRSRALALSRVRHSLL